MEATHGGDARTGPDGRPAPAGGPVAVGDGRAGLLCVLRALADPVRLDIVCAVAAADELPWGALHHGLSKSTVSHHVRVLRDAGLVHVRAAGTRRFVSLRRDDLEARHPGLLAAVLAHARPDAATGGDGPDA